MHLCHIVAPGDEDVCVINVLITAHGFVQAETGQTPCYGACHAEAGIGLHIVGADTALEQF